MKVITLRKEEIYGGSLLLVNAQYSLKNQEKITLASVDSRFPDIQMESHAADILRLILTYISSEDEIVPVSGYRSLEEQTAIFEDSLKENGETFTRQFVALPGHSEHNAGLAMDIVSNDYWSNHSDLDESFDKLPQYEWLINNSWKYGFILSYPKGKEDITGFIYEPWHYRFVGLEHAKKIHEVYEATGEFLTVNEYIEQYFSG